MFTHINVNVNIQRQKSNIFYTDHRTEKGFSVENLNYPMNMLPFLLAEYM